MGGTFIPKCAFVWKNNSSWIKNMATILSCCHKVRKLRSWVLGLRNQ